MDPELEAFVPLFPAADLTNPVTARENLARLSAATPAPDTTDMEIEDRTVPATLTCQSGSIAPAMRRAPSSGCMAVDS